MQWYYDGQIRRYVGQIVRIFSGFKYQGLDGKQFEINVPPATQHGSRFRITGQGLWDVNQPTRGDLFVEVALQVPTSLTGDQLSRLQQLKF
jgi:DnaJ-class molecular chaperone